MLYYIIQIITTHDIISCEWEGGLRGRKQGRIQPWDRAGGGVKMHTGHIILYHPDNNYTRHNIL